MHSRRAGRLASAPTARAALLRRGLATAGVCVAAWTSGILVAAPDVTSSPAALPPNPTSMGFTPSMRPPDGTAATVTGQGIAARIFWIGPDGRGRAPEVRVRRRRSRTQVTVAAAAPGSGHFLLSVPLRDGERLFGLGQRHGSAILNGQILDNWVEDQALRAGRRTSHSPVPMLGFSSNKALLFDTFAAARLDLGRTDPHEVRIAVRTRRLELSLIRDRDLRRTVARASRINGLPQTPPAWALGVWKTLIGGDARVARDVRRLAAADVPLDAVWLYDLVDPRSGFGWPWPIFDSIRPGSYRDPASTVRTLHRRNLKVLGYLNPLLVTGTPAFDHAAARGYLLRDGSGAAQTRPWLFGRRVGQLDWTNPTGAAWWRARVRHGVRETGFDGAMLDFGEGLPSAAVPAMPGGRIDLHNRWPLLYARHAHQAAGSAVLFARAGAPGTQRHTDVRFTGDQTRSWDATGLPSALNAMLSGSVSGWPVWGPDIAGFTSASSDVSDEEELWLRWLQLGALSPVMRDHLGDQNRDTVHALSNRRTLSAFGLYARLHRALQPELVRLARRAGRAGTPIVQPVWLSHPEQTDAWRALDQFQIGQSVLVAPVLRPGQRTRRLWLPPGSWRTVWSDRKITGPRWLTVPAPRDQIPLFVAAPDRELRRSLQAAVIRRRAAPRGSTPRR